MYLIFSVILSAFALPPNQLNHLTQRLEDASFSSDKLEILQNLPQNTRLTCAESVTIINTLSFPNDKKAAVKIMLPYLTDLENRYVVIDAFTFQSDKTEMGTLLDVEYAERVEAASLQQAKEHHENRSKQAAEQKMAAKDKELRMWEQRLKEWEQRLNTKEMELKQEADRLAKLQQSLDGKPQKPQHGNTKPSTDSSKPSKNAQVQWVGYCPQGTDRNNVTTGECLPFNTAHFNPFSKNGQQLLLQVSQPGVVELKMELGPETQNCKSKSKITSIQNQKISVQHANQIIDVGALVDTWYRENIRITAQSSGYGESLYLEDWQNCP